MSIASPRPFGRAALSCVLSCVLALAALLGAAGCTRRAGASSADDATSAGRSSARRRVIATERTGIDGPRGVYRGTPVTLTTPAAGRVLAYPPAKRAGERARTVVYLHGINGRAEKGCPFMKSGASEVGWLVCPSGIEKKEDGTASWGWNVAAQASVVTDALLAAEANGAAREPGVAVGFSQGSYVALDLVKSRSASFRGLVLLAAPDAHPSAQKLREAGVERVALGAGQYDPAHDALVADAARLEREGIEARFFDLGKVGHTYDAEDPEVLREAIVWAAGV